MTKPHYQHRRAPAIDEAIATVVAPAAMRLEEELDRNEKMPVPLSAGSSSIVSKSLDGVRGVIEGVAGATGMADLDDLPT